MRYLLSLILLATTLISTAQVLPKGSVWKYLDDGSNQGTAWCSVSYNDSAWASGAAQLGYGDGDEATVISYGNSSTNKHITYYFRKQITLPAAPSGIEYVFRLLRDDGAVVYVNGNEVLRSNMPAGTIDYQTHAASTVGGSDESKYHEYVVSDSFFVAGANLIAVEVHQRSHTSSDVSFDLEIDTSDILVPQSSVWKYLDDGSNQGTAWKSASYNDSAWSSGPAQLGYGDGDESTLISYGNSSSNKHITYYFRKKFNVQNIPSGKKLLLELLRDDGALVYINGVEVARSNMPSGNITYTTAASSSVAGSDEDKFFKYYVPVSVLTTGQNLIAAEVHQRSHSSSDVSFDLALKFIEDIVFRKSPYVLYPGDNDKVLILWQLYSTDTCLFAFGTDTTYAAGQVNTYEFGSDHQHKILLTGLTPATHYYYKVSANGKEFKGSFRTGATATTERVRFFAYGDTRTYPDKHDLVAEAVMNKVSQDPQSRTMIISTGDFVSNGDKEDDWDDEFFDPQYKHLQKMLANLPYVAAVGNHEGQGNLFAKYFPYPDFMNGRYYYSFDYGPVHFTVIDQFTNYSTGSTQYNWIVNDLNTTTKKWKIVVMHKPGWSAGGGHSNNTTVQNVLQPLFVQTGVQFVLTGHNHYYSRAVVNGIEHITTGGGGAPLYTPNPTKDSIVKVDKSYHYCYLDVKGDTLTFTAVRSNGSVIETFDYILKTASLGSTVKSDASFNVSAEGKSISVSTTELSSYKVEVFDSIGRRIYINRKAYNTLKINISTDGVYFVRINYKGKNIVKKVYVGR